MIEFIHKFLHDTLSFYQLFEKTICLQLFADNFLLRIKNIYETPKN